jgi:hypothetical protein
MDCWPKRETGYAWLLAIFLKRFVKSSSRHVNTFASIKATASVRGHLRPLSLSAGHWGKMSTGQWAWLSDIRSPIAEDQEVPRSIVPAI